MLQDEIWPEWVVKEKKLSDVETLLSRIQRALERNFDLKPEAAFGMFDPRDTGLCTDAELKRICDIFFQGVVKTQEDRKLLTRLVTVHTDGKINYKELGKFLDKRRVRQFKYVQDDSMDVDGETFEDD